MKTGKAIRNLLVVGLVFLMTFTSLLSGYTDTVKAEDNSGEQAAEFYEADAASMEGYAPGGSEQTEYNGGDQAADFYGVDAFSAETYVPGEQEQGTEIPQMDAASWGTETPQIEDASWGTETPQTDAASGETEPVGQTDPEQTETAKPARSGSLKIRKNVTVNGEETADTVADGIFTFMITGPNDYERIETITITNGASSEVQIDDLEPGTYTVSEDVASGPEGMVLVGENDITVEVAAGEAAEIPTAEFTNNKTEEAASGETEPVDEEAVRTIYVWDDGTVKVTASLSEASAIPDNAELVVNAIDRYSGSYDYDAYMDALNMGSDFRYDDNNTLLYDIAFIKDDIEIQPESGSVSVTFEFLDNQLVELIGENTIADVNVIHLPLADEIKDNYDTTAEAVNIDAEDIDVDELTAGENNLQVSVGNETVTFETSEFSVFAYTVDFAYTDPETGRVYTYNLEGAGSITLRELAVILGITTEAEADAFISNVIDVQFSNESLVMIQETPESGWVLTSLVPFSSEELLTITMEDGTVIEVRVTDVQESTDLTNFLTNAVITGATQNASGAYEIEEGTEYSIILSFAESSSYQFKNNNTLTYQMPEGIDVIREQTGPLKINIVYKGRTYQVDASYILTTDGLLSVTFDQRDPDYPRLEESTNVSFSYKYYAQFNGNKEKIHFSDDVERDIVFDGPEPGQVYAEKSATYDETTGKFHYTITVTATGDVTEVRVKDSVIGNALKFNDDVQVSGNSSSYTDNGSTNGFDYTFASMQKDEKITITYSADVDFTKDTDGDGKITADQTKNTVSVEPKDGDPHNSEYSREINFKYTVKKDGTETGTTQTGDKIINWSIDYNPLALVKAGGDTVTDRISSTSADYMKYYGDGIKVVVKDHSGNEVRTENISYQNLTEYSNSDEPLDRHWKYTIPSTDDQPYSYHITYQTVVDMDKINHGTGTAVTLDNTANGNEGSIVVAPDQEISVIKEAESFTTQEVNWKATLSVPQNGLIKAEVTDYLPQIYCDDESHFMDPFKNGSLEITGLLSDEGYEVTYSTGIVYITFYYTENGVKTDGLKPYPGGRNVYVNLTTQVNEDWLKKGYELGGRHINHTNTINFNGKTDTATVPFGKPGITKTKDKDSFKYTLTISGLNEEPLSIMDTFDTSLLEVDTSKSGDWEHMHIFGGTQYSQIDRAPVSYTDTETGIVITANTVPKQADGKFYPVYRIDYYLKVKDGVDLEALAIANGGEYDLTNRAVWADHETEYTYTVKYDFLDKELLNAGQLGGRNRTAQYKITFNSAKATLNDGEPMTMTDVLSKNLSLNYNSISITTDPAGANVPYSISGGKTEAGVPDGTTIATYTIPDSTKVVITYSAEVRGNSTQKIVNKVSVNGDDETEESTQDYGDADEGQGAIASFMIVKVDGNDANKKLSGVKFKIFAENEDLDFGENADHAKEIELVTDKNGEILFDGADYTFYFNETYHVQEVEEPEDYGKIGFDYLVTLTNDMAQVNYGEYIYYFSDSMQIKNWPLEGLVVEKQVDSDVADDKERYYTFKVSILNDDGTLNTDYNEKNGDDQFENGVITFKIKDREQKMFWGFLKGTKYKVEEIDAEGFATTVTYSIFDKDGNVTETRTDSGDSHTGELTQEDEVIVFKNSKHTEVGSLKIKKNVTVNGETTTGTTADGTYWFTVKDAEGNVKLTPTITITNGVSNEIQVDNLVPGTYTVSEDVSKNPSGMALVGDASVTVEVTANNTANIPTAEFTNDKTEVGSLKIKKNVTVNSAATTGTSADGTYWFTVKDTAGNVKATPKVTIKNGASNEVQVDNLVPGTYTVSEDTTKNPDGMTLTSDSVVTVEVKAGETAEIKTAEFTNNKIEVGSLKIKKNVTVNGAATTGSTADGTYTFEVKDAEGNVKTTETVTITNGASNEVRVDDLVPGMYTVSEDTTKNPAGMTLVGKNDIEVEVKANGTANIPTAEFTNNRTEVGSLKIKKNVTVNGETTTSDTADGTYWFTVKDAEGNVKVTPTITITNGASNEIQVDNLVPGTYTVSEDVSKNPAGMALVGKNNIEIEVEAGETAEIETAEFTNNKTEVGSLKIKKNVTVNGTTTTGTSADGTYWFTVKDAEGNVKVTPTITITNGASNEIQVDNLVPGTYTVSEDTAKNPDGMTLTSDSVVTVEVKTGETAEIKTAEFTNNRIEVGSLKIKKNVTVNGKTTETAKADGTYWFTVKDAEGNVKASPEITITNGASTEIQVDGLMPGTYTVSEDTTKNPAGVELVSGSEVEVKVTANNTANVPTAEFTNNLTEVGSLKIKKNVTVNGETTTTAKADGVYTFTITGPDSYTSTETIKIKNGASSEVQVDDLVPGTYTVSEDTGGNPPGMALVGENNIEIEVKAGETAEIKTAEFTNNLTEVGSLKIKKNVTVNGKAATGTSADGTYSFEVKDAAGNVKATPKIEIKNGASNEVQVDNLVPGTYTVSEDVSKNPAGMALAGENDVKVEVAAGETAEIKTAEFTNNKTEVGSLKIKKNVTVNGKATTGTTADGMYSFTITGPDSYKSTKTIEIKNGVGSEVQVDDLVPGTYTVSEDTAKNPDGMTLTGNNDLKIEVKANNTANIPTAEFTNNRIEVGSLKIKKNVTIDGKATTGTSADGTYTFTVKDADGNVKETATITIKNGASNEVQVDGLVPGTYTVSEDTTKNPAGMALAGENDVKIEVAAGETAEIKTAEFTNNKTEVGSLKVKKNVTVNGKATTGTSADGTYTFNVKDTDGKIKETVAIKITNGASNEAQVDNLVPGTYTVSEDISKNPAGMALVGDNDMKVEVTAGETAEIKTAEFTNNKIETVTIPVEKRWIGLVGKSVTVTLLADGSVIQKITLDPTNNWKFVFADLPKYDSKDGHKISYTISEEPVPGYTASISGDTGSGFVITNKETPSPAPSQNTPQTGDETNLSRYLWMLILSVLGLTGIFLAGRKRSRQKKS